MPIVLSGEESHSDDNDDTLHAFQNVVTKIKEQIRRGDKRINKRITKFASKCKQQNVGQNVSSAHGYGRSFQNMSTGKIKVRSTTV